MTLDEQAELGFLLELDCYLGWQYARMRELLAKRDAEKEQASGTAH